jgi:iron complex transport system substrate-binding protein
VKRPCRNIPAHGFSPDILETNQVPPEIFQESKNMIKDTEQSGFNSPLVRIITLVIIIGIILATAAILLKPTTSATAVMSQTRTITDMMGNTVEVPVTLNRIAITCCGGATHEVMTMGGADTIVAQPAKCIMPQLKVMQPSFSDVTDAGSFDEVNVEQIIALHPDVVIASVTSEKGNTKIRESGIPVVTVMTGRGNMSLMKSEFAMIGQLLGRESNAKSLLSYWDAKLALVNERVSTIPQDQRKKVYYMLGKTTHTNGGGWWGQEYITAAGGINVAEELGTNRDTSVEQVIKWNPDVIILSSNEGTFISIGDVKNNTQLSSIAAIKNNQIYECPIGSFWWDRPSPESPLGILWLAKSLYPDKFSDIDLKTETQNFYKTYYGYSLSDAEYGKFLNPKPASAK